jgi:hypothetical protein
MQIVKPKFTLDPRGGHHLQLDFRDSPKLGEDLALEINEAVRRTQEPIMQELPDQLVITQTQHASLNAYTEEMLDTVDRMYLTPYSVMEVVVDREYKPVAEIAEAISLIDEINEQEAERERANQASSEHGDSPDPGGQVPGDTSPGQRPDGHQ